MPPGRLLLLLVVMTATLGVRQPCIAGGPEPIAFAGERATWVQRLGTGVARSFSRIGLMQRVTLRVPMPRLEVPSGHTSRPFVAHGLDLLRTCLPPPAA